MSEIQEDPETLVVVLRYFMGLKEEEAAATMGISIGALKSHHSRAVRALRLRFGGEGEARLWEVANARDG